MRRSIAGLLVATCLPLCGFAAGLAITGVTLIDGTGAEPTSGMTIVIEGERVTTLGKDHEIALPDDVTIVEADGKYAIPGLADMHVHFGSGGLIRDADVPRLLRQFLFYGVTTTFNLGGTNGRIEDILEYRRRTRAGELMSPGIIATGGLFTIPGSHPVSTIMDTAADTFPADYNWYQRGVWVVETPDEIAEKIAAAAAAGMDGVKIIIDSGPSVFGDHHPQMSLALVRAAVSSGRQHGLPVFAHVSSIDELEVAIEAGVHAVVHLVSDPTTPPKALFEAMVDRNIFYIPTLSIDIWPDVWGDPADPFMLAGVEHHVIQSLLDSPLISNELPGEVEWEYREQALAALRAAHENGVRIVAGSDSANPTIFPGYSMHHELALMVEAGMSPMEALVAATRGAAEMVGAADRFGTIAPGMPADILLLRKNPLDDIRNARKIEVLIKNGAILDRQQLISNSP